MIIQKASIRNGRCFSYAPFFYEIYGEVSDGTLWEGQIALYFRWTCLPDCAVLELDADYRLTQTTDGITADCRSLV